MSKDKQNLKTVLITGGGSGIGLAAAELLIKEEYRVVLAGRNKEKLEDAAHSLSAPERVSVQTCNLRDLSDVRKMVDKVIAPHKTLYAVVNNAGVYTVDGLQEISEDQWNESLEVNLKAPLFLIQAATEALAKSEHGGRVINVASTAGITPNHFAIAYSISKAGLIHLTKTLAKELGPSRITVNCVCPGLVRTPLHETYHTSKIELEEFYNKKGAKLPLGRIGEPSDVVSAIRFFLSPEASWVTGEAMVVDGGRLLV